MLPTVDTLAAASIDVITRHQSSSGAYPASPNFPVYRYSWFRDGSFIADGVSRTSTVAGVDSADAFHRWCAEVLEAQESSVRKLIARAKFGEEISDAELLPTRFTLDGGIASEDWWDFQLDGYGTWLWALAEHLQRHDQSPEPYRPAAQLVADYLSAFWDRPCYDWWEENRDQRHPSTLAAIAAGLEKAANVGLIAASDTATAARGLILEHTDGHLVKWLGSTEVDASLISVMTPFDVLDIGDPRAVSTIDMIEKQLTDGGVHRYLADVFYGGGQWPVLAGFLGWHYSRAGKRERATELLDWIRAQATPTMELPEQAGAMLHPAHRREWEERWGPNATPLLWSHGMFLILATELDPDLASRLASEERS